MSAPTTARTRDAIAADAIADEIRSVQWQQAFNVNRHHRAPLDLNDTKTMVMLVQANGSISQQITRRHKKVTHAILITVRKNVDINVVGASDALSAFCEKVADYFRQPHGKHRIAGTQATVMDAQLLPVNPDEQESETQFARSIAMAVVEVVAEP